MFGETRFLFWSRIKFFFPPPILTPDGGKKPEINLWVDIFKLNTRIKNWLAAVKIQIRVGLKLRTRFLIRWDTVHRGKTR